MRYFLTLCKSTTSERGFPEPGINILFTKWKSTMGNSNEMTWKWKWKSRASPETYLPFDEELARARHRAVKAWYEKARDLKVSLLVGCSRWQRRSVADNRLWNTIQTQSVTSLLYVDWSYIIKTIPRTSLYKANPGFKINQDFNRVFVNVLPQILRVAEVKTGC